MYNRARIAGSVCAAGAQIERVSMRQRRLVSAATALLVVPLLQVLPASTAAGAPTATQPPNDTRELTRKDFTFEGKPVVVPDHYQPSARRMAATAATPPVGTVRPWLALDDANGRLYLKEYTLRAVGDKIEVWVANDLSFPAGDCRNQIPNSTTVTDAQAQSLVTEFDTNMFPKETAAFSTPPDRDGSNAQVAGYDFTGDGDHTVALVDNVKDDNYYTFPAAPTYIAGFFSAQFNELVDRNVMTIDAFDWAHRTGPDPVDEPTTDLCTSRPGRPHLYEGTFAHEWQHLLMYYTDPFEGNWVNEGLSDFAQTLVGYVDPRLSVFEKGGDSHIYCFQGYGIVQTPYNTNPRDCGGPENSLNLWGESNPNAVLADYGHAYSLMQFLYDRYGLEFMSKLHHDDRQGIASLQALLAERHTDVYQLLHDFQSATLLDKMVDTKRGVVIGVPKNRVTSPSLNASVNLANPAAYATPGAAPNGADYVPLQDKNGKVLRGKDLKSLTFDGASTLPSIPLTWTVVSNDPDRPGDAVLFSGNANNTNATAVTQVAVPTTDPTLRFDAKYGAEAGYDYGYVLVSTDGGATYKPIAGDKSVPGPLGPALNGTTNGFEAHTYDLSAYAGQTVLLGFQYISDGGVNEGGLRVDNISVGGTTISDGSSLDPFDSPTEIRPTPVANWNLRLVGYDENNHVALQVEYNGKNSVRLGFVQLLALSVFPKVVAMVSYDEPTELVQQYAPYKLTVNGVVQPGGGA